MRTVFVPALGSSYSGLGFGCASLGSRISPAEGGRALAAAFDRGITWYDVAPPYGDSRAEALLGAFLIGKRDKVAVCTKVGIPWFRPSLRRQIVRPLARVAIKAFPELRSKFVSKGPRPHRVPIKASQIEDSVVESLRRLRTDYVDVLALHEPTVAECREPAVLEVLERVLRKGYTRCISIAGNAEAINAGLDASSIFRIAQFRNEPFSSRVDTFRSPGRQPFLITHSVFGGRALQTFKELFSTSPEMMTDLRCPATLLLDLALANNAHGIVLASMFSLAHIDHNCACASRQPDEELVTQIRALLRDRPLKADLS